MRFSEAFGLKLTKSDDWFDPHLGIDTKLFVDPIFLFTETSAQWKGAHDELVDHFAHCFTLIAGGGSKSSPQAKMAQRLLVFPEPVEFGLGYTEDSTRGAGSGGRFAQTMVDGIAVAISRGILRPKHIEEVGILTEGIGADRISDATCNVLKHRFIKYTQRVAARHGIPMASHVVVNSSCIAAQGRWLSQAVDLPTNPLTGKAVLLVPRRFLNTLPVLNANDWFDSSLNSDLRQQLNVNVGQRVSKRKIVELARQHPDRIRTWADEQESRPDLKGYDFDADRRGLINWDRAGREFAAANPLTTISQVTNQEELRGLLQSVLELFKRFVEQQGGWRLLWNDDGSEKPEEALQLAFLGVAQNYLRLFNVELDREVELGRGPVDFKLSQGSKVRILVEFKKTTSGKFWNGLEHQLTSYMTSDGCAEGWFVAVRYRDGRQHDAKVTELHRRTAKASLDLGATVKHFYVDARRPVSASRI